MAKGFHKAQRDLFREAARADRTYFQLDWPDYYAPLTSSSLDAVSPWYQTKMRQLSDRERVTTDAILKMNADKPVSTPFTVNDVVREQSCSLLPIRFNNRAGVNKEVAMHRYYSDTLGVLEKIGVLRPPTDDETSRYDGSRGRGRLYVFADAHVEKWYRAFNARVLYPSSAPAPLPDQTGPSL